MKFRSAYLIILEMNKTSKTGGEIETPQSDGSRERRVPASSGCSGVGRPRLLSAFSLPSSPSLFSPRRPSSVSCPSSFSLLSSPRITLVSSKKMFSTLLTATLVSAFAFKSVLAQDQFTIHTISLNQVSLRVPPNMMEFVKFDVDVPPL